MSMLVHRLPRWPNIDTELIQRLMFAIRLERVKARDYLTELFLEVVSRHRDPRYSVS